MIKDIKKEIEVTKKLIELAKANGRTKEMKSMEEYLQSLMK